LKGIIQNLKKLSQLVGEADSFPDPEFLRMMKSHFQALEQRVNLLEAYLQTEGQGKGEVSIDRVQSALAQVGVSIQSTLQVLKGMQEGQRRSEERLTEVRSRLEKVEAAVRSLSMRGA